jgi:hypothetical protein
MDKAEMRAGLLAGRRLVQEEWSQPDEIRAVDELVAEGVAQATPWEYRDGFQCERRIVTRIDKENDDG